MLFEKMLTPKFIFGSYSDVTPEFMVSNGYTSLISDIDNTLAPYEITEAPREVADWARALKDSGIKLALVSNNHSDRVEKFNSTLGLPAFSDVKKPSAKYIEKALESLDAKKESTLFLGDQLLTDALAAHRAGLDCAIVPPIKDKKNLFFKVKRLIERPYMKKFSKKLSKKPETELVKERGMPKN